VYLIAALILCFTLLASIVNFSNKLYYVFLGVFLFLLGGLRWGVGTDWQAYFEYFTENNTLIDFLDGEIKEFLFAICAFAFKSLSEQYTLFLLFQSAIVTAAYLLFLYKYTNGSRFVLMLYFLNSIGNIYFVRQTIASAFFLLSLHYFISRKLLLGLFSQILGVGYHYTSGVLVFFNAYISRKFLVIAFPVLFVLCVLFGDYISSYISLKMSLYFMSESANIFFEDNYEGLTSVKLIWIFYLMAIIYILKKVKIESSIDNAFAGTFFSIYTALFIVGIFAPQFNRFTQYFSVFEQVALVLILNECRGWRRVFFVLMVIILYCAKYYFRISSWPGETDIYKIQLNL
jgi:hypothetical protein